MKKNEATVFVFIASVIIGILISMNIGFRDNNKVFLNIDQYNEAYNKRNTLYREISSLKHQISESEDKLRKYEYKKNDLAAVNKEIKNEVSKNEDYYGLTEMEGEGLKITLNDAKANDFNEFYMAMNLVHDIDLWFLINDLRVAGAEAIAINGNRIVSNTYSYCGGTYIEVGGVNTVAPFYIDVIGNKVAIKEYLLKGSTCINGFGIRKIQLSISEHESLKIPPYNGDIEFKYAKKKE